MWSRNISELIYNSMILLYWIDIFLSLTVTLFTGVDHLWPSWPFGQLPHTRHFVFFSWYSISLFIVYFLSWYGNKRTELNWIELNFTASYQIYATWSNKCCAFYWRQGSINPAATPKSEFYIYSFNFEYVFHHYHHKLFTASELLKYNLGIWNDYVH